MALSCHIALNMLCQEMHEARLLGLLLPEKPLCHSKLSLSLNRGRAVTIKEYRCGERKKEGGGVLKPSVLFFFQV